MTAMDVLAPPMAGDAIDPRLAAAYRKMAQFKWRRALRPDQELKIDQPWRYRLWLAGRGYGKGISGGTGINQLVDDGYRAPYLAGRTLADVRDIQVLGKSGVVRTAPDYNPARYVKEGRRVEWANGAVALMLTAEEPDGARGHEFDCGWFDELGAARPKRGEHLWDNIDLATRAKGTPYGVRHLITTTGRPTDILIRLEADPETLLTRGSPFDNEANLDEGYIKALLAKWKGTRWERQELYGEIVKDVEGAFWTFDMLDDAKRAKPIPRSACQRVVVAIDPAGEVTPDSARTAIAVCGQAGDRAALLAAAAGHWTPMEWARVAVLMYRRYAAGEMLAEVNYGGLMVEDILRLAGAPPVRPIRQTRPKDERALPIAFMYEQGRVWHAPGLLPSLDEEFLMFPTGAARRDLVDAVVMGFEYLFVENTEPWVVSL